MMRCHGDDGHRSAMYDLVAMDGDALHARR